MNSTLSNARLRGILAVAGAISAFAAYSGNARGGFAGIAGVFLTSVILDILWPSRKK